LQIAIRRLNAFVVDGTVPDALDDNSRRWFSLWPRFSSLASFRTLEALSCPPPAAARNEAASPSN